MDFATTLGSLAGQLFKLGAPQLGGIIGTAIGGPAGTVVGGVAGKVIEELAGKLGTPATPEAVKEAIETKPEASAPIVAQVEATAPDLVKLWQSESDRSTEAQRAEIDKGFGAWQFWRGAWQAVILGGWAVILLSALFGALIGLKPLMPLSDLINNWGSVTLAWLAVFNGGHTIKEIAPHLGFGRKRA
ncbi:hypothetical protein FQV39_28815 [Bosea sp. F3-2]|uniref:hypothetical protein n=1 Tax=Bosea sp. F3-2 TaxID=2599640 RepID=UPI0011EED606|nr:hypothetical protein [Bosea sp. F3-2]QEL26166.1 hypothetical protein FQV39_28815 [Bosea sp. F3-2]